MIRGSTLSATTMTAVVLLAIVQPLGAQNRLDSERGYWDFTGLGVVRWGQDGSAQTLILHVENRSTDDSYRSDRCPRGMASALVDWEIWHPDAGKVASGQARFSDVCNGASADVRERLSIRSEYAVLEVRWNVTTPNGGHSFHRDRRSYSRR